MKQKIISRRIISVIIMIGMMISVIIPFSITKSHATATFEKATSSTVIDSKYSFSPRFIQGVTTFEPFGEYSYDEDLYLFNYSTKTYSQLYREFHHPIRLVDDAEKGQVGAWYRNVGEYRGEMLDLKITIENWDGLRAGTLIENENIPEGSRMNYPTVFFTKKAIQFSITGGAKGLVYRIEFFNHNEEKINTSGHLTYTDIDSLQAIVSLSDIHGYLTPDTNLEINGTWVEDTQNIPSTDYDTPHWLTITWDNQDKIDFMFTSRWAESVDLSKPNYGRGTSVLAITGNSTVPFDTPEPVKSGAESVISGEDTEYQVAFTVPQQPTGKTYTEFKLTDTLPDGLKYTGFTVVDDAGANVTAKFTGSIDEQTFTLTPKDLSDSSFYFKGYTVAIKVKVEDKDWREQQGSNGKVILKNSAKISAKVGDVSDVKSSNEVSTEVKFKITTSTDGNGTITHSISNISAGEDKNITFTPNPGYAVDAVCVDGENIHNSAQEYKLTNITKNHTIDVTFTPEQRTLSVMKMIDPKDINFSYGEPKAIFKIEGTDVEGKKHKYEYVVSLQKMFENTGTPLDDMYVGMANNGTLRVTAGTYTITEIDTSHYGIKEIMYGDSEINTVKDNKVTLDLINNDSGLAIFTNTITNYNGFSHSDSIYNEFYRRNH